LFLVSPRGCNALKGRINELLSVEAIGEKAYAATAPDADRAESVVDR
jgi:hypothetical protein